MKQHLTIMLLLIMNPARFEPVPYKSAPCPVVSSNTIHDKETGLFDKDEVFDIILKGEIRAFLNDAGKVPKKFPMQLMMPANENDTVAMDVVVRQRGHFRRSRQICELPPTLIEFPK